MLSQLILTLRGALRSLLNAMLHPLGYAIVNKKRLVDYYLHQYESYEQYRRVQTHHNRRKLHLVWADEVTLSLLCDELRREIPNKERLVGLCHGTRNGFEQRFIADFAGFDVIGTEISDTADQFERTVHWDFHEVNEEWLGKFDFVYSNSLDHAWNPRQAVETWLNQLNGTGVLALECTHGHGPEATSEMDPFGVRPTVVPYVLCDWFGHDVSMRCVRCTKSNFGDQVWLYLVRKSRDVVVARGEAFHGDGRGDDSWEDPGRRS